MIWRLLGGVGFCGVGTWLVWEAVEPPHGKKDLVLGMLGLGCWAAGLALFYSL